MGTLDQTLFEQDRFVGQFTFRHLHWENRSSGSWVWPGRPESVEKNIRLYLESPMLPVRLHCGEAIVSVDAGATIPFFMLQGLLLEQIHQLVFEPGLEGWFRPRQQLYQKKADELYALWQAIPYRDKELVRSFFLKRASFLAHQISLFDLVHRSDVNLRISMKLLKAMETGGPLFERFRNERLAIYGAGKIGQLATRYLMSRGFSPTVFIDEYTHHESMHGLPVLRMKDLERFRHKPPFDVILVTPVFDFVTIREQLAKQTDRPICSLEDVL